MNTSNTSLFFTIPQHTLNMSDLSNNDRMVLGLITDRHNLSKSNNTTHDGRICLYYTRKSIATDAGLCEKTVIKSIKKLKMHGLIEEVRQGQGKANIIYLVTPEILDNHKNCTFSNSKTVKNTSPELKKVQRNKNKLNKNKLNNKDDDVLEKDKVIAREESSSISKENLNIFLLHYSKAMNRDYILKASQEIAIINLINEYGMDKVLKAISHIEGNPYLMEHNDPDKFVMYFTDIYNNKYVNWGKKPEPIPKKKTRFNTMDSRTWDFEELERLEEEYIARRYGKNQEDVPPIEETETKDITPLCNTIEELEDVEVENIKIGGIELEEVEDIVGDETVKQICFGENRKKDTSIVLTEREQILVTRYRDMSAVNLAYVRKELTDCEYQFLHRYYNNSLNYKVLKM